LSINDDLDLEKELLQKDRQEIERQQEELKIKMDSMQVMPG